MSPRFRLGLVAVFACAALAHGSSLGNGFVNWDDEIHIGAAARPDVGWIFVELFEAKYAPLTLASLALEHRLVGDEPFLYHLDNLLLHALNAVLAACLVARLVPAAPHVALGVGLLFGVHPVHAEVVAWVSERKGVLSATFYLLSLLAWLSFLERRRAASWAAAFALAAAALLAKPIALSLPIVLVLLDLRDGRRPDRRVVLERLPFFALAGVLGLVNLAAQPTPDPTRFVIDASDLSGRLLLAVESLAFYTSRLFWPVGLSVFYDDGLAEVSGVQWGIALAVAAGALALVARRWSQRANALFGLLFYGVALAPTLKVVPFGFDSIWNDRYLYLPSIGLLFALALPFARLPAWRPAGRAAVAVGVASLGTLFGAMSWQRCQVWKDSGRLWSDVLRHYPQTVRAHERLGAYALSEGDLDRARDTFETAIALRPDWRAYFGLGHVHHRRGDPERAARNFERATQLKPDGVGMRTTVARFYAGEGDVGRAVWHLEQLLTHRPDDARTHHNLGMMVLRQNRTGLAQRAFERAIELDPELGEAWVGLARIARAEGDARRARAHLERARDAGARVSAAEIEALP